MSKDDYKALNEKIRQAQSDYHTKDAPTMSDYDYDQLVAQLREIEAKHPEWVLGESSADAVGATIKRGLYSVKHSVPMLSLDNVFNAAALQDWYAPRDIGSIHTSYKYDGLAVSLTYIDHILSEAATRGDRFEGESILHNVAGFDSIPKSLHRKAPGDMEVRGELIMFNDEFERYNDRLRALGMPPSINPRNAAAGIARRLHKERMPGAQLVFIPYSVRYMNDARRPYSHSQSMANLAMYGFEMPYMPPQEVETLLQAEDPSGLIDYLDARMKERLTLPFGIDGLVFRVDVYSACDILGSTSRAPRWAVAYKFPPEEKTTVVRNIRLQIGRTGNATPVAETDPILVGGVTVTNATLHNEDHIKRLDLAIGDTVIIRRAGDVVPEISAVVHRPEDRQVWTFPTHCECGAEIVRPTGQANHVCTGGLACSFQVQRAFEHFVSRDAMDIDGIGPELIAELLRTNAIRQFSDLYRLTKEQLTAVSSETSEQFTKNVLDSIDRSRKTTVARFIYALGIPQVGQTTAKRLADWFGSFHIFRHASPVLLLAVPDVGPIVANGIYDYFKSHDQDKALLSSGLVELTDQMGPTPEFAQYANVLELMKRANLKGLTQKKYLETVEKLAEYFGWPYGEPNHNPQLPPEDEWLRLFYTVHQPTLTNIARDNALVREWAQDVRSIQGNQPLAGSTYVITGSFDETLGSRQALGKALEDLGAKVSGSVSNKTTAVFVGDAPGANKLDKAKALSIPTLFVNDLRDLLAKHSQ